MLDYIIDTNILILYFAGKLRDDLPTLKTAISVITEIEILAFNHLSIQEEKQLRLALQTIEKFFISNEIKEKTIEIKRQNQIKLPDAIICATAITCNATLLSNDKQLSQITELKLQTMDVIS